MSIHSNPKSNDFFLRHLSYSCLYLTLYELDDAEEKFTNKKILNESRKLSNINLGRE